VSFRQQGQPHDLCSIERLRGHHRRPAGALLMLGLGADLGVLSQAISAWRLKIVLDMRCMSLRARTVCWLLSVKLQACCDVPWTEPDVHTGGSPSCPMIKSPRLAKAVVTSRWHYDSCQLGRTRSSNRGRAITTRWCYWCRHDPSLAFGTFPGYAEAKNASSSPTALADHIPGTGHRLSKSKASLQ
jgi:hypothetical protein